MYHKSAVPCEQLFSSAGYIAKKTRSSLDANTINIHSFIPTISIAPLQVGYSASQRRSRLQHGYCIGVSRRSAQATVGKGLAQGPYVTARAGVEPTTLRLKVIDSTKAPSCPSCACACGAGYPSTSE